MTPTKRLFSNFEVDRSCVLINNFVFLDQEEQPRVMSRSFTK